MTQDMEKDNRYDVIDIQQCIDSRETCDLCDCKKEESPLQPFFKDGIKNNCTRGNVLFLCKSCFNKLSSTIQMVVSRTLSIDVAHYLPGHPHCGYLHGHTMDITVGIRGYFNLQTGMIIDFEDLKQILKEIVEEKFDHRLLNKKFVIPTSEFMTLYIYNSLKRRKLNVEFVRVYETKNNYVEITNNF